MKALTPDERKRLTPAEVRVLAALSTGKQDQEIAQTLGLCTATVKSHLHRIYRKLGVPNRVEAVRVYEKMQGGT